MKKRYGEEQIVQILREADTAPTKAEVCRKYGIRWKQEYQGLEVSQLRKLKQLETENARLKKLVAEQVLANEALKEALVKKQLSLMSSRPSLLVLPAGPVLEHCTLDR